MEPRLNDLEWPSSFSLELAEIDEKASGISGIIAVVDGRASIIALHDEQRLKRGNHPMLTEPDNLSVPVNIIYSIITRSQILLPLEQTTVLSYLFLQPAKI